MARMVKCIKLGREAEGLDFPPYPGPLGKRIYAPRTLGPATAGTLGIAFHELPQQGRARFVIDEIAPDSPMRLVGAQVGDQMDSRPCQ